MLGLSNFYILAWFCFVWQFHLMAKAISQNKIDPIVLLELVNKGLKQAEIARYFDVQPSSVRSKLLSLSRRDPAFTQALSRKKEILTDENASLHNRLDSYAIKMFTDAGNVLKRLQTTPIPDDVPSMIQRSDLQLKGLQIVEKVQKLLGMNEAESPRNIQVNQITTLLAPTTPTNQKPQVVDVQWLAWICVGSFEKMFDGGWGVVK